MNSSVRYWAVVPAAGIGQRMQADCPKQYLPLAGKTIVEHTLTRLLALNFVDKIFVAISRDDSQWASLPVSREPRIETVAGGAERCDSVLSALDVLVQVADENDWVMVHDAARPCVSLDAIEKLRKRCSSHACGGLLAHPVSDTLKRVSADGDIERTVDRARLWAAQTPQMFRLGQLRRALQQALNSQLAVTDEASAMELAGFHPCVVESGSDNLKITRPEDLPLAEMILERQTKS